MNVTPREETMNAVFTTTAQLLQEGKLDIASVNPQILEAIRKGSGTAGFLRSTDDNGYKEHSSIPSNGRVTIVNL